MTDRPGDTILRISPYNTSSQVEILVSNDVKKPWGIDLNPCGNFLFFFTSFFKVRGTKRCSQKLRPLSVSSVNNFIILLEWIIPEGHQGKNGYGEVALAGSLFFNVLESLTGFKVTKFQEMALTGLGFFNLFCSDWVYFLAFCFWENPIFVKNQYLTESIFQSPAKRSRRLSR